MQVKIHNGVGSTIGTFDTDELPLDGNLYFSFDATTEDGTPYEGDFSLWFEGGGVTFGRYDDKAQWWEAAVPDAYLDLSNPNNFGTEHA